MRTVVADRGGNLVQRQIAVQISLNVIFDPLIGYFYKLLILGKPAAELTLAWNVAATSINAVTSTIVSVVVYMAVRPALRKAGMLPVIGKKSK